MNGKLMFVPDTHAVVPREPTDEMVKYVQDELYDELYSARWIYKDMISKAQQLTTPPVFRWERCILKCGNVTLCYVHSHGLRYGWVIRIGDYPMDLSDTIDEARRAAEKALGLPEIEEV